MAKRQRHVYPTDEIAHLWAHQRQSSARNPQGNFYFEGATIFSYGSHFPIARHYRSADDTKQCVLFTTRKYSSVTAGHLNMVRGAISHLQYVFRVYDPTNGHHDHMLDYQRRITALVTDVLEAKAKKSDLLDGLLRLVNEANRFSQFFGLGWTLGLPASFNLEEQTRLAREFRLKHESAQAKRKATLNARDSLDKELRRQREEKELAERPEKFMDWIEGKSNAFPAAAAWHGLSPGGYHMDHHRLRIRGGRVQSSGGAVIGLHEAKVLLAVLDGTEPVPEQVGGFGPVQIDLEEGLVKIGCHRIQIAEIRRLEATLVLRFLPTEWRDHPDLRAMLTGYHLDPTDTAPLVVAADWLQDKGVETRHCDRLRWIAGMMFKKVAQPTNEEEASDVE